MTVQRLINLWPLVRTSYPSPSVNAPFHGYSKLQLHGTFDDRMTGIELATLQLRRPCTNRLSYVCSLSSYKGKTATSLCHFVQMVNGQKLRSRGEGTSGYRSTSPSIVIFGGSEMSAGSTKVTLVRPWFDSRSYVGGLFLFSSLLS